MRQRILKFLSFVPDKPMLKMQYRLKLGRWPDLKNPKRFTEKIQLYKMYYRNPVVGVCSDKYAVREYLKNKGYGHLFPLLYGVYEKADDIEFDKLPDKFVIKTNDGGGGYNIIICKDKSKLDIPSTINSLNSWLNKKDINGGREWGYSLIKKSVVMVEEYLEDEEHPDMTIDDFKFYCFNGEIFCIQHDVGRYMEDHTRTFYDQNWNNLHVKMLIDYNHNPESEPKNFEEMKTVVRELSKEFPHVRIDLYSVNNKIYFGEFTFYTGAGYNWVDPDDFDLKMGEPFDISTFMPKNHKK